MLSPQDGTVQTFDHLDKAETFPVDKAVADASVDDYDALVLPGGVANPDALRTNGDTVGFVRDFVASGKPVAAICHAPWTLVEAGVVKGKRLTSYTTAAVRTDAAAGRRRWPTRPRTVVS